MSHRKRWGEIYTERNPFELAQSIVKKINAQPCQEENKDRTGLKYLWAYVSHYDLDQTESPVDHEECLGSDEWLGVIDECAACGVEDVIFSLGRPLPEHSNLIEVVNWAVSAHEMNVGLHFYGMCPHPSEVDTFKPLDTQRIFIFVENRYLQDTSFLREYGFKVFSGEGKAQEKVVKDCRHTLAMACVGADGTMYTCGLVLGDSDFCLGHFFDQKLLKIINDDNVPHIVPTGFVKKHPCNGCPPLMAKMMRESSR